MRLPSLVSLAERAREVVVRFPWTMAAGTVAAVTTIIATTHAADMRWGRIAMVAALGVPLTLALTLVGEERGWSSARRAALNLGGVGLLLLFYAVWPGPDRKHEAIRYFQLSAALHLLVAALPFWGQRETSAFWQYNRRLFLGILRASLFSHVLFIGLAIALGALDKLFGVDVPPELYARMGIVIAFVLNTAIFLSGLPLGLRGLADDTTYPRVLKVFAQYILTPLVFIYLILLIAYLVKIVAGGEWPSGWIGWLVTSVAIAGLLGFLLVHPLRHDPAEGWIRTYTRWVFIGLIPAAAMLLVAFWKRILPYGLTEPRLLAVLLGFWLLAIAVGYTIRQDAGIRRIPVTLAALLLLTLYGPLSVTSVAVASQGRRLSRLVSGPHEGQTPQREASAALRFLLDHGARQQIAAAIPGQLPKVEWDSLPGPRDRRDSVANRILAGAGMRYVWEYSTSAEGFVYFYGQKQDALPIGGYEWMVSVTARDTAAKAVGGDSVRIRFDSATGKAGVRVNGDSLVFDLGRLASTVAGSNLRGSQVPAERLRLDAAGPGRRGTLMLEYLSGRRTGEMVRVNDWHGTLFLGR